MRDRLLTALAAISLTAASALADYDIDWHARTDAVASTGTFAPYFIGSNTGGLYVQGASISERAGIDRHLDLSNRFSYGFGAEVYAGYSSATGYEHYDTSSGEFSIRDLRPASARLYQLWGTVKWRGIFVQAGMKEYDRSIFNSDLGSGDLTLSNNSIPMPRVTVGFIDFQDIPLTNGWVQIQGEISYGKPTDSKWLENHYNHYNSFITTGSWFHYKRCYFRTNPEKPFSVTIGMQHAAQFGGLWKKYEKGALISEHDNKVGLRDFLDVFIQHQSKRINEFGSQEYYNGNHLGSWDLRLRYRFHDDSELTAYMQSPWEDGSGIGKLNGWDGVWGLEYKAPHPWIIDGVVVEYLDFTNHSGPIHWAPDDHPGTSMTGAATGADDYYNNYMYNGWANYGMAIGSPIFKGTVYNRDGYMRFTDNHLRGFHIGLKGSPINRLDYRLLISWRTSNGTPLLPRGDHRDIFSLMGEATVRFPSIRGLSLKARIGFDAGSLYQPTAGAMATIAYEGLLTFKKRKSK